MKESKEERLLYIQKVVSSNGRCEYEGPTTLYKYRPFDQYTFSMLENSKLFLSGAYRQDDETECMTRIDASELCDYYSNNLKPICIELILSLVKPYCDEETFEQVKQIVYKSTLKNGEVRRNILLDYSCDIQELVPGFDVTNLVNFLANIPARLDEREAKEQTEKLITLAVNAQHKTGICSFGVSPDNDDLWNRYASKGAGYCVEYDLSNYEYKNGVLPVIYDDERDTRIVVAIVGDYVGTFVSAISQGKIKADNTQYLRLFLSKCTKWENQDEWRILGDSDVEFPAPKVKRIILGKDVSKENEEAMISYCSQHNIEIIKNN